MTKSTITRERLQEIAEDGFLKHGESKALAGMVLAAMGGDPVEWINGCNKSVPAALRYLAENPRPIGGESSFNTAHLYQLAREVEFMAEAPLYRHAQPAPEHPEVLPCSVLLEPGLRFGKGIKTSTMLAALARRAVHESDMAALSPEERAEFQAGIEDFKSLIAQQPVVPDEKPMPNSLSMYAVDAVAAIAEVKGWNACRAAMLAAAPQLPDSDPATVPGKWIPVSERMPEDEQEVK
ncbi:Eaa1 [Klebsiella pneumoniae]|nr:Eaa1 [Klebsiella pneumoniae]